MTAMTYTKQLGACLMSAAFSGVLTSGVINRVEEFAVSEAPLKRSAMAVVS